MLASIVACGWLLGLEECICLVVISGICVDYVLHIACAFAQVRSAVQAGQLITWSDRWT